MFLRRTENEVLIFFLYESKRQQTIPWNESIATSQRSRIHQVPTTSPPKQDAAIKINDAACVPRSQSLAYRPQNLRLGGGVQGVDLAVQFVGDPDLGKEVDATLT